MGELIGAHKQAINHEGWVIQGEMVCVNGPVEQPQREDALFLPSLYTQIGIVSKEKIQGITLGYLYIRVYDIALHNTIMQCGLRGVRLKHIFITLMVIAGAAW